MIAEKLVAWYANNKRALPWRKANDPYKIWLSEIILQQTRVVQGTPYYLRFIEKFPDIHSLAKAPEEEVLRLWQGLGYYSRARNLHDTARTISEKLYGKFPSNYKELLKLKGIGPYTAAAISSIAYNEQQAVVDGNVYRVLSRLYNIHEPINETIGIKIFKKVAQDLVPANNPGDYNQAIMELGALICKPQNPSCLLCPIQDSCEGLKLNTVKYLPKKVNKSNVKKRYFHYFIHQKEEKILMKKRTNDDIWASLYDFPLLILPHKDQMPDLNTKISPLFYANHKLTHQNIFATFWKVHTLIQNELFHSAQYFSFAELENLPKPKLIVNYLSKHNKLWQD